MDKHTANLSQFPGVAKTKPINLRPRLATGKNITVTPGLDFTPILNTQLFRRGTPKPSASVSSIWKKTAIPDQFSWNITGDVQSRYQVLFQKTISTDVASNLLSKITNQGLCGSCWAITASHMLSDRVAIYYLERHNGLSVTQLLTCVNKKNDKKAISLGCLGGDPYDAMQFAVKHGIIMSDCSADSSYEWCSNSSLCQNKCVDNCDIDKLNDMLPTCDFSDKCKKIHVEVNSARYLGLDNQSVPSIQKEIKRELYFNGPVVASYMVYMDFMVGTWSETNGIYIHTAYKTKDPETGVDAASIKVGGHAICIVGYGNETVPNYGNVNYWVLRNSWSNKWKDKGYCKIAMTDVSRKINHALSLDRPIGGMGGVLVADVKFNKKTELQQHGGNPDNATVHASGQAWLYVIITMAFLIVIGGTMVYFRRNFAQYIRKLITKSKNIN
jgi:hypothetical protein